MSTITMKAIESGVLPKEGDVVKVAPKTFGVILEVAPVWGAGGTDEQDMVLGFDVLIAVGNRMFWKAVGI